MSKTKVLTVRVEEGLYRKLQEDSQEVGGVAQYVRELVYNFYYPKVKLEELHKILEVKSNKTSELLKQVEERKEKLEESIGKSKESIEHLQELEKAFNDWLKELNRMVKAGIEEIPQGAKR